MSASERDPNGWEFRILGRALFHLPRRAVYMIVLGLSIGVGIKSPDRALNFIEGAFHKLLQELHDLRVLAGGTSRWISPSARRKRPPPWHPAARWLGTGSFTEDEHQSLPSPASDWPVWTRRRSAHIICHADAERLRGYALRLREAPCSTSAHRRSVEAEIGGIRLTGRYAHCLKHGLWWTWVEVLYDDELLWTARYYLRC